MAINYRSSAALLTALIRQPIGFGTSEFRSLDVIFRLTQNVGDKQKRPKRRNLRLHSLDLE